MSDLSDPGIRIGISACLLGERVRYDGAHKRHDWLVDELGPHVTWVPVCPEVELGLGVPRETISLIRDTGADSQRARGPSGARIRLIGSRTGRDLTDAMERFAAARADELAREHLSGYVFKSRSPSCGLASATISAGPGDPGQPTTGPISRTGRGLFAAALVRRLPGLPVIEDSQLDRPGARDAFVERVRAYRAGCSVAATRDPG